MPANSDEMKAEVRSSRGEEVPDFFTTLMAGYSVNPGVCTAPPGEKVGDLFTKQDVMEGRSACIGRNWVVQVARQPGLGRVMSVVHVPGTIAVDR